MGLFSDGVRLSVTEREAVRCLHTAGVSGSSPLAPTNHSHTPTPSGPPPATAAALVHVLLDSSAIQARVAELARAIERGSSGDAPIHLVAVLKGAFMFLADLMRAFQRPVTCDFLAVSSYGGQQVSSGEVRVTKDLDESLAGRDVVIVEDIVDSGLTLAYLQDLVRARRPRSLRTVCLLDKRTRRRVGVPIEYVGFEIEDRFVVGYGLDLGERYRQLPFVGYVDDPPEYR